MKQQEKETNIENQIEKQQNDRNRETQSIVVTQDEMIATQLKRKEIALKERNKILFIEIFLFSMWAITWFIYIISSFEYFLIIFLLEIIFITHTMSQLSFDMLRNYEMNYYSFLWLFWIIYSSFYYLVSDLTEDETSMIGHIVFSVLCNVFPVIYINIKKNSLNDNFLLIFSFTLIAINVFPFLDNNLYFDLIWTVIRVTAAAAIYNILYFLMSLESKITEEEIDKQKYIVIISIQYIYFAESIVMIIFFGLHVIYLGAKLGIKLYDVNENQKKHDASYDIIIETDNNENFVTKNPQKKAKSQKRTKKNSSNPIPVTTQNEEEQEN